MSEESPSTIRTSSPGRRVLHGVGVGGAVAAAVAAIAAPIVEWTVRSPRDFTSSPLMATAMGAYGIAIGVGVLVVVGSWLLDRFLSVRGFAAFVAVILAVWTGWNVLVLYRSRTALPFIDSTGASVIAAAAALAAVAAVVLAMATIVFARDVSGRTALCAFLVVAVAITALTYSAVRNYRAGVWHPQLTVAASTPNPVPDTIGPVGYRTPLGADADGFTPEVYAVGNGFIVDTRDRITAYNGATGAKRWMIGDYGHGGRIVVVGRSPDDTAGVVVVFLRYGLIAFDGSTGDVLWRRQLDVDGNVTAAGGSVDALGMSIFTADSAEVDNSRTQFYSLDPATGSLRWKRHISCSNPSLTAGTPGQFAIDCGHASIMDAHTGNTIDVPGEYTPKAGDDAYVVHDPPPRDDSAPTTVTRVMDPTGKVIDELPGTYPVGLPHNGFQLAYGAHGAWLLRDYRNHRSIQVPIHAQPGAGGGDVDAIWLDDALLITNRYSHPPSFELLNLARPTEPPTTTDSPCPRRQSPDDIQAAAGAVLMICATEAIGLVPAHR